ncbi:hypothetical protein [Anaerosolibacter sp.]|uniref:hypothetical protein n=1 Tax=Anaerosolibacter sp. TaxID=1872527 RepID=UPI0039F05292
MAKAKVWDEEKIMEVVRDCMKELDIEIFPSKLQLYQYLGNHTIRNNINKVGGAKVLAAKYGIPIKMGGKKGKNVRAETGK